MTPEEAAQAEAKRRYPLTSGYEWNGTVEREAFVSGAAFEREQLRELLEAAREYRDGHKDLAPLCVGRGCVERLLAAAAALNEEGGD